MKIRGSVVGTNQKPAKVIVKATDLTEEQKAQARENIGAAQIVDGLTTDVTTWSSEYICYFIDSSVGNIDSALDSIIAIQNSLIGGDGV